jgi:hypothetical protein
VSPDSVQGNAQRMDPYAYVEGNPETRTDPTGQKPVGCIPGSEGCSPGGAPAGGGGSNPCVLSGGKPQYCGPEGGGGQPSPGTGGGGSTGGCHSGSRDGASAMLCTGGQKPLPRKPTLTDPCAGNLIYDAQSDANHGSNAFWKLAEWFALIAALGEAAALGLEALAGMEATVPFIGEVLAGLLSGAAVLLQTLVAASAVEAIFAGIVATEFGDQSADHTPSDWSTSAMENFRDEVDNTIAVGSFIAMTFATLTGLFSDALKSPIGSAINGKVPGLAPLVGVLFGGIGGSLAEGEILSNTANYWIGQMNNDLGYA